MRVLTVNAGSSSLKLAVVENDEALASEQASSHARDLDPGWLDEALARLPEPEAVGHRVVHGGRRFTAAALLDDAACQAIEELTPLAPLHQPAALAGIRLVGERLRHLPAVACFDTAFFATLPAEAATYALPQPWREQYGVRRYGFHGLSHAYLARRVRELVAGPLRGARPDLPATARPAEGGDAGAAARGVRLVSCHLGAGASVAALLDGRPLDTTMGFTPAEGLVMATRPGLLDPGAAAYLLRRGVSLDELEDGVEHGSGLAGLAGTPDLEQVLRRAATGDGVAGLARDVYLHRLVALVWQMAAALGGVDVLAFAGGVGEHSSEVRAAVVRRCAALGTELDEAANAGLGAAGGTVSPTGSAVRVEVVPAREDLEIARQVEGRLVGVGAA